MYLWELNAALLFAHLEWFPILFRASRPLDALADAGVGLGAGPPHQRHVAASHVVAVAQQRLLPGTHI